MHIYRYPLGQMQANCYFLIEGNSCLIIDPGDSADFILEKVMRENLQVKGILATHGHFDHIMAVGEIQMSLDIPLYIHKEDAFLLKRIGESAKYFLGYDPVVIPPSKSITITPGIFEIDDFSFEVIHVPGHTPGSCCFYFKDVGVLFTGDTLFLQGVGRYDFSYSNKDLLKQSLQKLFQLPEETRVLSGHGEETTIGFEKKYPVI
jgi:hydroxyacylglutathione hydrolase